MREGLKSTLRSLCPVSVSLETFGDRWSLLIVRDLMVRGYRTFGEFQQSGERIASNILADRLRRLEAAGIISAEQAETDRRRVHYRLTGKGIDLAPVLLELLIWGARHETTAAPRALIDDMAAHRDEVLAEVRRRWEQRDPTPLLPPFGPPSKKAGIPEASKSPRKGTKSRKKAANRRGRTRGSSRMSKS